MCSFIPCRPKQVSLSYLTHMYTHWRLKVSRVVWGQPPAGSNLQQLHSERISRACDGAKVCPGEEKASCHTLTAFCILPTFCAVVFSFRQEWETLKTVSCSATCVGATAGVSYFNLKRDHSMNRSLCVTVNPNVQDNITPPVPIMLGMWSQWHQLCLSHASTNLRSPWVVHTFAPCVHRCVRIVRGWTAVAKCTSSCVSRRPRPLLLRHCCKLAS